MKKILFLATAFVFTLAVKAQSKVDSVIKMNVETHDFGKVKQGIPVDYYFEIKNISDAPIVVENTWASCGCTTPDKITEPILPGKTAKLKVQYNAAAVAPINKDVFIKIAGIESPKSVHISGEVLSVEAYDIYVKEKGNTPPPVKNDGVTVKQTAPKATASSSTPTISPVKN